MIQSSCRKHPEPSRLRMLTAINLLMSLSGHLADVAKTFYNLYMPLYAPMWQPPADVGYQYLWGCMLMLDTYILEQYADVGRYKRSQPVSDNRLLEIMTYSDYCNWDLFRLLQSGFFRGFCLFCIPKKHHGPRECLYRKTHLICFLSICTIYSCG